MKTMYRCKITACALDEGTSIEEKVRKATETQTPIDAISPMIYTNAKDGVLPQCDIRTDRFDMALDAIDNYQGTDIAKSDSLNVSDDRDMPQYVEQPKDE